MRCICVHGQSRDLSFQFLCRIGRPMIKENTIMGGCLKMNYSELHTYIYMYITHVSQCGAMQS